MAIRAPDGANKTINSGKQLVQEGEKQSKGKYKQVNKKITKTNKQKKVGSRRKRWNAAMAVAEVGDPSQP